jgi:hypothetical protein
MPSVWRVRLLRFHLRPEADLYCRMAPTTVEAKETQKALLGKKWFEPSVMEEATNAMEKVSFTHRIALDLPNWKLGFRLVLLGTGRYANIPKDACIHLFLQVLA